MSGAKTLDTLDDCGYNTTTTLRERYLPHADGRSIVRSSTRERSWTKAVDLTAIEQNLGIGEGFQRGERWAFEAAARLHFQPMVNYVAHLLHDRERAIELVQESFYLACRSHQRFDPKRPLAPWLFRIARNMAYKEHNRRKKNPLVWMEEAGPEGSPMEPPASSPGPRSSAASREVMERIHKAMERLKPDYRDVLILRLVQGLPSGEAAQMLEIPVATVNTRLYRALEQLRKICRREGIREEEVFG